MRRLLTEKPALGVLIGAFLIAFSGILFRAGLMETVRAAKKVERFEHHFASIDTEPGEFRKMRLTDMATRALEMRGQPTRGLFGMDLVERALTFRDSGMNSTSDFAVLLETAVNKVFLGQYAITPVTWPRWCGRKSLNDFRTSTFYRPGTFGALDNVPESRTALDAVERADKQFVASTIPSDECQWCEGMPRATAGRRSGTGGTGATRRLATRSSAQGSFRNTGPGER